MLPIQIQLPTHFLDAETRCDYTISPDMKKVWAVELDLLHEFQWVCEQHHLQYYAAGGTLLGAVRHKGYIPWDDDIDVMMFREDYDKLLSISQQAFHQPYCFQTTNIAENCFLGHAQLRNSRTTAIPRSNMEYCYHFNQGIFIDIFVLDHIPSNRVFSWLQFKMLQVLKKILRNKVYSYHKTLKGRTLHSILDALENYGLDFQKVFEHYENIASKMSLKPSEYVSWVEFLSPPKYKFRISDFEQAIDLPFEFTCIKAPQNYHDVLKAEYGDYMKFVKAPSLHGDVFFDPDRPYTKYIPSLSSNTEDKN